MKNPLNEMLENPKMGGDHAASRNAIVRLLTVDQRND